MNNAIPDWLLKKLPYQHNWINVGKEMHVMEKGSGKPIVMVHGNPMWGYLYKKVLDGLDDNHKYIIRFGTTIWQLFYKRTNIKKNIR